VKVNGLTGVVITKLDVLRGIDPISVATRYSGPGGASFEDFPYHQSVLHKAQGELVELPGWDEDITGARRLSELPDSARSYLSFVEEQLGVPVVMVSVGPGREQMIWTEAAERLRAAAV
jgi:adenylosuccinate synthase